MASLVRDFQRDIVQSSKGTTELLRTAKLISVKLGLTDIASWVGSELSGYNAQVPPYRIVSGGDLQAFNPYHGWRYVGHVTRRFPIVQPVSQIEELLKGESIVIPLNGDSKFKLRDSFGDAAMDYPQQVQLSSVQLTGLLDAVKDKLLDWSTELESRGILGENMSFEEKEKKAAQKQVFHIQNATGIFGSVDHSTVSIYDYSTLHQTLKTAGVPQSQRNELENLLDQLKTADGVQKRTLLDKAKQWTIDNEKFLGAGIALVKKALGIGE